MRLRRKKPETSLGRRRRQADDSARNTPAFAYRAQRSEQQPAAGPQKHFGAWLLKRFGMIILLIALLISAVNVLSLSSDPRIMSLTSDSANSFLHDQAVYETAAGKLLAASVLNRNKITVNTGAVRQGMLKEFPELSDVSVTLPLLSKRPIVYVETAQPALILAAQNGSYVIDSTGKALLPAGKVPAGTNLTLPLVTDQSGLKAVVNRRVLTSGNVDFVRTISAQLAARNFAVDTMTLPPGGSELDVRIKGQPYTVKFNLESGTARQQAGTFLATQAKLQAQNIVPPQYIDVRLDGRAYYK